MNKLTFFFAGLLLIPFIFDEAYAQSVTVNITATDDGFYDDFNNNGNCGASVGNIAANFVSSWRVGTEDAPATTDCYRSWIEFDTTSIDDDVIITDVTLFTHREFSFGLGTCTVRHMALQPTINKESLSVAFWDDMGDGASYVSNNAWCISASPTSRDLGATADTDLQANLGVDWFAVGMQAGSESQSGADEYSTFFPEEIFPGAPLSAPTLQITYTIQPPDPVTDLIITNLATTTLDLTWTTPSLNGGTHNGTQINFTTPFGNPLTVITNNTNSTTNAVTVSGLAQATPFSFRVSVWNEVANNATGNIVNTTTLSFGNFTVGAIDLEATNLDFRTWQFSRTDLNSSAYSLSVIYPDTYNATCQFHFKFANIDLNHSNLVTTIPSANQLEAIFTFNNTANEVIDVLCIDETLSTTPEGRFLLTQTNFILLQQFEQFRDGTFGTMGMFGAIDLITLFGIVFATIGFNRINESVGGFFMLVILGVMAFFQIIVRPTALSGAIAVVVMLVVMSTRKV